MAGDWNPGLDDPNAMEGLPPLASPLTANGEDPDEAALKYFGGGAARAGDPVRAATNTMQQASASAKAAGVAGGAGAQAITAPQPGTQPQPVTTTTGSARPATAGTEPYQQFDKNALTAEFGLGNEMAADARKEGEVPSDIVQAQQKQMADQQQTVDPANYKPSFGQRVLRGLRGAGIGLLTGGVPGLAVGALEPGDIAGGKAYGAPTDAYDSAVSARDKQLTTDQTSLGNAKDNYARAFEAMKARQTGLTDAGTRMGGVVTGATGAQNADTNAAKIPIDQQNADTEALKAQNQSPQGKIDASQAEIAQRTQYANANKMPPGYLRNRYILTGDLQPQHDPTAQEIELAGAERAFRTEHGRGPQTLEEWQQLTGGLKNGAGDKQADANLRTAGRLAATRLKDLKDNFSRYSVQWDDNEKKTRQAEIDQAQDDYDNLQSQLTTPGDKDKGKDDAQGPKSHRFSRSTWSAANPKGDADAAIRLAQAQGYEVVP